MIDNEDDSLEVRLGNLGYVNDRQRRVLAMSVLEKPVKDLSSLREDEALDVLNYAKRVRRDVA